MHFQNNGDKIQSSFYVKIPSKVHLKQNSEVECKFFNLIRDSNNLLLIHIIYVSNLDCAAKIATDNCLNNILMKE